MLRNANQNDFDFIYKEIIEGAKNGHFDSRIAHDPRASKGMEYELKSILINQKRINGLGAFAIIYEVNGNPVGFIVVSAGDGNKGNELWMGGITAKYRNKKHGSRMLCQILEQYKGKNLIVTARCAPNSEIMYNMLVKNGFQNIAIDENGFRGLTYTL